MDAVLHHIPVYMWAPTLFGLAMGARFFFHAAGTFRTLLPQSVVEVEDALLGDDDMSIRDVNRLREAVRSRLAGTWILSFSASIAASMWSIASWPDSTAYLYFNSGYLTWLCALYFFWKMEWLGCVGGRQLARKSDFSILTLGTDARPPVICFPGSMWAS